MNVPLFLFFFDRMDFENQDNIWKGQSNLSSRELLHYKTWW